MKRASEVRLVGDVRRAVYGLSSCPAHRVRGANRMSFASSAEAHYAGFRACRVCQPDNGAHSLAASIAAYDQLSRLVRQFPTSFSGVPDLAAATRLSTAGLAQLIRDHAHQTPEEWMLREKLAHAAGIFSTSRKSITEVAHDAGFATADEFSAAFGRWYRVAPDMYRTLDAHAGFGLALPANYRAVEILAYHGRDKASLVEQVQGSSIRKALLVAEGPVVLHIDLAADKAWVKATGRKALSLASSHRLHRAALAMLGLLDDVDAFEAAHPAFVAPRAGLRLALLPDVFDALCWGIIGQQINIAFAASLRRELVDLAGLPIDQMRSHPTPQAVAQLDPADLTTRRFSRSKARYLIDVAQSISDGRLDLDALQVGSALKAELALTAERGVGTWTARYVLMRSGFADIAPVGDSGIATALGRLYDRPDRPDVLETARLMAPFAPYRSLASMHLWASLVNPAALGA